MVKSIALTFLLIIAGLEASFATAWDEPWADDVIKGASSLVLAKVVSTDPDAGIRIVVYRTLAGKELRDSLVISDFYLLSICSRSGGHGPEFHTKAIDSCYFFIKENKQGKYCIATPTTGFDYVTEGNVMSTYRHSYHQASTPVPVYEYTMKAIFENYHGRAYDEAFILAYVNRNLNGKPAGFGKDEINTFYAQHVALECVYHLRLKVDEVKLLPFLNDTTNFHNQVSGARAMIACNTDQAQSDLLKVIRDTSRRGFVRVMCIWSLAAHNPKNLKTQLEKIIETATEEDDSFGGNLMDPRICTHLPAVSEALKELVDKL